MRPTTGHGFPLRREFYSICWSNVGWGRNTSSKGYYDCVTTKNSKYITHFEYTLEISCIYIKYKFIFGDILLFILRKDLIMINGMVLIFFFYLNQQ